MSSVVTTVLVLIQQSTIRYGFPVLLILGNLGNLFCIVIFSQKHHRQKSCSQYLLASAVFSIIGINWGLGTNTYALYRPPDPFSLSLSLCRIRGYLLQMTAASHRSMIVLACIDRFAVTSTRASWRRFNTPKMSLKMIGCTTVVWMIATSHLLIFESIENNRCYVFGTYGLFYSIYIILIHGFSLPFLMIVFSFLIWKNLKAVRARVQPSQQTDNVQQQVLSKRDLNLIWLVFVEVSTSIILSFLYPITSLYIVLVNDIPNKSQERIQIEAFINFLALIVLFYLNYCSTFYVYVTVSKPFRKEIKHMIFKYLRQPIEDQTNPLPGQPVLTQTIRNC